MSKGQVVDCMYLTPSAAGSKEGEEDHLEGEEFDRDLL